MAERKKRILIFAHYYAPDTASTGQILKDLAEGMKEEFDVTVICVVPSYDGKVKPEYRTKRYYMEELGGVRLIRVRVPEFTKADKRSRVRNIITYFFGALRASRKSGAQDYIFTISQPPVLGGLLGVISKWRKHAKMIYCVQDFNPEQIMAVGYSKNKFLLRLMMAFDKFSCRYSDFVITVGRDLGDTLKRRFHKKRMPRYTIINNWIDEKETYPLPADHEKVVEFKKKYGLEKRFVIMYSGNMGLYYDLENIMEVIGKIKPGTRAADGREVAFVFAGAGSVLDKLTKYVREHHMENVVFVPYQDKEELIYSLNAADVHWCVNAKGIKGVSCPSKFYGIAAVAKPVLGVLEEGSEIRRLIEETGCGLVCEPGEYGQIERNIRWFMENAGNSQGSEMGQKGYEYLVRSLTKDMSVKRYVEAIEEL
ncbi:MAG: glycosyltransferase family 4 protein [Hungatella sp.]|nr:glycosyltransferase family 4 protein [Hungatella sp.]